MFVQSLMRGKALWRLWRADLASSTGQIEYLRLLAAEEAIPYLINASNNRWSTAVYERSAFIKPEASWELGVLLARIGDATPASVIQERDGMSSELAARVVLASTSKVIMEGLAPRVFHGTQRGGSQSTTPLYGYYEDGELCEIADSNRLFYCAWNRIERFTGRPWYPSPQILLESIAEAQTSGELTCRIHSARLFLNEETNNFPDNWSPAEIRQFCRGWSDQLRRLTENGAVNGSFDCHRQLVSEFAGILGSWAEGEARNSLLAPQGRTVVR